jgi:hypothetical protein
MNNLTKKIIKLRKNNTKKIFKDVKKITPEQQMVICKKSYNTYNTF